jgi:leader peptidase (prepilin peptidase)/N-methyltransferase
LDVPAEVTGNSLGVVLLEDLPHVLLIGVAIALGLLFGSFLNVVIYRLPRAQNLAFPPSTCPACGARIKPYDNVPVLSWLLLRGRARCCGAAIASRYPLVECLGGLLGWAVMKRLVLTLPGYTELYLALLVFASYFALALALLALVFIDLEFMLLPDELTLGALGLGLLTVPLRHVSWLDALFGAAGGFLFVWLFFDLGYRWLRGKPGMGLGDAKLLAVAGAWFGWPGVLFALCAGAIQGTLFAIAVFVTQGKIDEPEAVQREREQLKQEMEHMSSEERAQLERELAGDVLIAEPDPGLTGARIPFGPFLVLATLEFLFLGEWFTQLFFEYYWLPS